MQMEPCTEALASGCPYSALLWGQCRHMGLDKMANCCPLGGIEVDHMALLHVASQKHSFQNSLCVPLIAAAGSIG